MADSAPTARLNMPAGQRCVPGFKVNLIPRPDRFLRGRDLAFVDPTCVAEVTRLNLAAFATLALAPKPPQKVCVEVSALDNITTLRWHANTATNLAGYRVVWRAPDSRVWQHGRGVGRVEAVTLAVSKDNVVFGVAWRVSRCRCLAEPRGY